MDIFDLWVNLVTEQSAQQFVTQEGYENIPGYLGSNQGPTGVDKLLGIMDELGVATGIFTGGLDRNTDKLLDICSAHPGRFLVAGQPELFLRPFRLGVGVEARQEARRERVEVRPA